MVSPLHSCGSTPTCGVNALSCALVSPVRPGPDASAYAIIGWLSRLPPLMDVPLASNRLMEPSAAASGSQPGGVAANAAEPVPARTPTVVTRATAAPVNADLM